MTVYETLSIMLHLHYTHRIQKVKPGHAGAVLLLYPLVQQNKRPKCWKHLGRVYIARMPQHSALDKDDTHAVGVVTFSVPKSSDFINI